MESIAVRVVEGRRVSLAVFAGLFDDSVVEAEAIHAQSARDGKVSARSRI